jgi:hypothetical protein
LEQTWSRLGADLEQTWSRLGAVMEHPWGKSGTHRKLKIFSKKSRSTGHISNI